MILFYAIKGFKQRYQRGMISELSIEEGKIVSALHRILSFTGSAFIPYKRWSRAKAILEIKNSAKNNILFRKHQKYHYMVNTLSNVIFFLLFRCRYHHHLFCSSIAGLVKWKLRISWANGKQIMVMSAWHNKIHSHNSPF